MHHNAVTLFPDVLLVADECQMQQAKTVLSQQLWHERDTLGWAYPGIVGLKAKEKHCICTGHKNSMKRLLNHKIMFQPQYTELSYL